MWVLVLALVTLSLSFSQELKDAFGVSFGTPIKDLKVLKALKTSHGRLIYVISPPEPDPSLDTYVVETTADNRVMGVWGVKRSLKKEECRSLLESFARKVEKELGVGRKKPPFEVEGFFFEKGNTSVILKCLEDRTGWSFYAQFYQ